MTYFPLSTPDKDINKSRSPAEPRDAFDEGAGVEGGRDKKAMHPRHHR